MNGITAQPPPSTNGTLVTHFVQPYSLLAAWAQQTPNAPAIVTATKTYSFGLLADASARLASLLRDRGIGPGDLVALNLPSDINALFTWATLHEAAVTCVFLPFMIDDDFVDVKLVVTAEPIPGLAPERTMLVTTETLASLDTVAPVEAREYPSAESLVRIAFTSGTTGRPKAIAIDIPLLESYSEYYGHFHPTEGGFFCLMPPIDGGGWVFRYFAIAVGRPYLNPGGPAENAALLRRSKCRNLVGAAGQLAVLVDELERTNADIAHVNYLSSVGAQLPSSVADALMRLTGGTPITNAYGSTEGGGIARRLDGDTTPNYMGELLPEADIQIVDPDTYEPLPAGEVGLIGSRGEHVIDGYYRDPEATAEHFIDGWFYSGDLAHLEGNKVFLDGRLAERINAGGVKVDPNLVDDVVLSLDCVDKCAAFALRNANGIEVVAAAVVLKEEKTDEELTELVKGKLSYATPRRWFRVDSIPHNSNGKPLRRELTERFS